MFDSDYDDPDLRDRLAAAEKRAADAEEWIARNRDSKRAEQGLAPAGEQSQDFAAQINAIPDYVKGPDGHLIPNPDFNREIGKLIRAAGGEIHGPERHRYSEQPW